MMHLVLLALLTQADPRDPPDAQDRAVSGVKESADRAIGDQRADEFFRQGEAEMRARNYAAAVDAYSTAQRFRSDFPEARRGEALALYWMSAKAERAGNYNEQRRLYAQAIELDPSLAQGQAYAPPPPPRRPQRVEYIQDKPSRQGKWIGVQLTAATETWLGIGLSGFFLQHAMLVVTLDTIKPAIDIQGKALFLKTNWTPYLGVGGHITLLRNVSNPDFWQSNFLHVDLGAQYMHPIGFYMELGLSWFPPAFNGGPGPLGSNTSYYAIPLPHLALGWAFGFGS